MSFSFPDFQKANVLVIGDIMLDSYWQGGANRLSPEAPVPVVNVKEFERRLGGAANVALNMQTLGSQVTLLGLVGKDNEAQILHELLEQCQIKAYLQENDELPTITKLRIISQQQQLLRLDFEECYQKLCKETLLGYFDEALHHTQLVVLSDYAKGTLSNVPALISRAIKHGRPVIVDPKGTDYEKYRYATLLTPNLKEFEAVVGRVESEEQLVNAGMALVEKLSLDSLLITRGEEGMTLLQQAEPPFHLKTEAKEVFDVTGAGDTVIGVLSAALAANTPIRHAISLANKAAGIVVSRLGASSVTAECLRQASGSQEALSFLSLQAKARQHKQDLEPYEIIFADSTLLPLSMLEKAMQAQEEGVQNYLVFSKEQQSDSLEALLKTFAFINGFAFLTRDERESLEALPTQKSAVSE